MGNPSKLRTSGRANPKKKRVGTRKKAVPRSRQRVPRTRAGGTWTEARYFGYLRGLLRAGFSRYPPKHMVRKNSRRKSSTTRGYDYLCACCEKWYKDSEVQVDHITPAGSLKTFEDLPGFVERLYCDVDQLQILCNVCHRLKTNREREERKNNDDTHGDT